MSTIARVCHYAHAWRTLRAWGAPLPAKLLIEHVSKRPRFGALGVARPSECRAIVRVTGDLATDLSTVLHELAHLAAPNGEGHGDRWRNLFVRATCEVAGSSAWGALFTPDDFDIAVDLDEQVVDAVRAWIDLRT